MSAVNNMEAKGGPSNFEKFIQSKLNQVPTSSTGKFVLPKLSFTSKLPQSLGNKAIEKDEVKSISKEIDNLNLNELHNDHNKTSESIINNVISIDLTKALNLNNKLLQSQILHSQNNNTNTHISEEIFEIPFLDGDIEMINIENKNTLIRHTPLNCNKISDNINLFNVKYKAKCKSKIGKIFKLKYYCTKDVSVDHTFKSKPIKSFDFSTKSPDDKVIQNLQRKTFC